MKVILLENMDNLGLPGNLAEVRPGYYRNFLQPRGIAVEATTHNLRALEERRRHLQRKAEVIMNEAKSLGDRLRGVTLKFIEKVGENNRLFGSVTTGDIAARLAELGFEIDRRKIHLSEAIKATGKFIANVKLHTQLSAPVTVIVEAIPEPKKEEEARPEPAHAEAAAAESEA